MVRWNGAGCIAQAGAVPAPASGDTVEMAHATWWIQHLRVASLLRSRLSWRSGSEHTTERGGRRRSCGWSPKEPEVEVRQVEHAAHDLRWLKTTRGFRIDRCSWMASKMTHGLLVVQRSDEGTGRKTNVERKGGRQGMGDPRGTR